MNEVHRQEILAKTSLISPSYYCSVCWFMKAGVGYKGKRQGKAVPLQAWSGPEVSRKLRFPDYMTTAQDAGKVVSLTYRTHTSRKCSWYSFLLEAESTPGPQCDRKEFMSNKTSNNTSWDRTSDSL